MKGFTLIEILLVSILIAFIIGFSAYWHYRISQSGLPIEEGASLVISVLNLARQKALIGEENDNWGVWLVNNQKNPDYLYLFKGSTSTIKETFSLPSGAGFLDPGVNSSKIIIFQKFSGITTSTTIQIGIPNSSFVKNILVSTSGAIYLY